MSVRPAIDHDIEQPQQQSVLEQITSSKIMSRYNGDFPLFTNQILDEYNLHWMKHINLVVFLPTAFVFLALFFSQCGLIGLANSDGDKTTYVVRLIGLLTTFSCDFFTILYCSYHILRISGRDHEAFMARLKKWFSFRLEDAITITGLCAWSLLLIARMLAGPCPPGASLWQQQTCNPYANQGGIPTGMVPTLYSLPFLAQLLMRCISLHVLVMCYILSFGVVAFCVFYTNSSIYSNYPSLIIIVLFANASFEITRLQRLSFVDTLKDKERERLEIEQVKKEQKMQALVQQMKLDSAEVETHRVKQQLQLDRAEDEKRLKEVEAAQLRSMIGNVVHDLKTPLFAIEADMDMIKMCYSYISKDAVNDATARMHQQFNLDEEEDDIEPHAIFETMWSTIRFMIATINRGQDYMKASHNVALVPSNGTFEFADTLTTASRCIHSIIPAGRHLIIHELPAPLRRNPMLISDSLWVMENVLCLTSNAIKYSDSGDVDLFVTIEPTPTVATLKKKDDSKESIGSFAGSVLLLPRLQSQLLSGTAAAAAPVASVPSALSVMVTIEDHGVGVSEEVQETLFQPFRQAQRHTGGTGLGLYSMYKRMEALGGDCGLKPRSDGRPGSAFWFSFPYRPDTSASSYKGSKMVRKSDADESNDEVRLPSPARVTASQPSPTKGTSSAAASESLSLHVGGAVASKRPSALTPVPGPASAPSSPPPSPPSSSPSLSPRPAAKAVLPKAVTTTAIDNNLSTKLAPLRVLVTDDAPTILKVCKRMLTINGHTVDTAVNGNESLEKLKAKYMNQEYDALVTDIQMPVMDGIECTKRFRVWEEAQQCLLDAQGLPRHPRFLIVGMSANCDSQTKQDSLDAGMDSFCPKPFKYEDFEAAIAAHNVSL